MKFTKKKLALAIGSALITMSVLVSGCSTGSDKKADTIKIGVVADKVQVPNSIGCCFHYQPETFFTFV